MGNVIACYAGIGKTCFSKTVESAIDLVSMPYSWILPPSTSPKEHEAEKAAPWLLTNPLFPENYIHAILDALGTYDYVLIPPIDSVLRALEHEYELPYLLIYPHISLKEEYRQRYISRGNGPEFLDVFIGQWDERIHLLESDCYGTHIVLNAGEHLSLIREKIDEAIDNIILKSNELSTYRRETIAKDTDIVAEENLATCIFVENPLGPNYIFPINISREASFIYHLGQFAYQKGVRLNTWMPLWVYQELCKLHNTSAGKNTVELIAGNREPPLCIELLKSKREVVNKINAIAAHNSE